MFLLNLLIINMSILGYAQRSTITERIELQRLLEERKMKFDTFIVSLEKRSGIFGNKTKKDIQRSNDVLKEIVVTDNNIIRVLNRAVDFKNYEKTSITYDYAKQEDQLANLLHAADILSKQVETLQAENASLKIKSRKLQLLVFLFAVVTIWTMVLLRRKNKIV